MRPSADLLTAYHSAVHERTVQLVSALADSDYERVVDTRWDPPVTLLVRLVSVLDDAAQHLGQAAFVRGSSHGARGRLNALASGRSPGRAPSARRNPPAAPAPTSPVSTAPNSAPT